jgi:hypothetical protein
MCNPQVVLYMCVRVEWRVERRKWKGTNGQRVGSRADEPVIATRWYFLAAITVLLAAHKLHSTLSKMTAPHRLNYGHRRQLRSAQWSNSIEALLVIPC